ncbi:predicted protein [Sclerotinia sclerotiorum 1980 UF-70]|uniref:Uncharacterized protein n=1 Tax=Sclerotinia sclerotiorum (strain ATCC 18683 / 1980 / Ss-1) TaxID=665079 RepID=A7F594_SCLS1|nr:predicted protein [Sclerotinia sclerotiorum 1980 UF-70]EDN97915.1 predicted protein [Sclerotinia sclerotiorum 1980 UF-70]
MTLGLHLNKAKKFALTAVFLIGIFKIVVALNKSEEVPKRSAELVMEEKHKMNLYQICGTTTEICEVPRTYQFRVILRRDQLPCSRLSL